MKYSYQIRTGDYEYINGEFEGTADEAVTAFLNLKSIWSVEQSGPGLSAKEWNSWLDGYLSGRKAGSIDEWNQMNEFQKKCINEIKKAHKRLFD